MTLFAAVPEANPVFHAVLEKYFGRAKDEKTQRVMGSTR